MIPDQTKGFIALAVFGVLFILAAVLLAPRCEPGQSGTEYAGMFMQGCG